MMLKKLAILLFALLLPSLALAEAYEGTTVALSTVSVYSDIAGTLKEVGVEAGSRVEAGDALLTLARENGFSDVCVLRDLGGCDRVVYAARTRGIE